MKNKDHLHLILRGRWTFCIWMLIFLPTRLLTRAKHKHFIGVASANHLPFHAGHHIHLHTHTHLPPLLIRFGSAALGRVYDERWARWRRGDVFCLSNDCFICGYACYNFCQSSLNGATPLAVIFFCFLSGIEVPVRVPWPWVRLLWFIFFLAPPPDKSFFSCIHCVLPPCGSFTTLWSGQPESPFLWGGQFPPFTVG